MRAQRTLSLRLSMKVCCVKLTSLTDRKAFKTMEGRDVYEKSV